MAKVKDSWSFQLLLSVLVLFTKFKCLSQVSSFPSSSKYKIKNYIYIECHIYNTYTKYEIIIMYVTMYKNSLIVVGTGLLLFVYYLFTGVLIIILLVKYINMKGIYIYNIKLF